MKRFHLKHTGRGLLAVLTGAAIALLPGCGATGSTDAQVQTQKLVIAEPVHLIGYLPLYVAQHEGYFAEQGLEVEVIQATGGAHVTAVISGDAWGVIGGVDSNALGSKNSSRSSFSRLPCR